MVLYYITDRAQFPGDEPARRRRLLEKIGEAAQAGVDFIQLREKDLPARDLAELGSAAVRLIRDTSISEAGTPRTRLLINSRTDVALAIGADGVHLPAADLSPVQVRAIWRKCRGATITPVITVSCHTVAEVAQAAGGADFAVFAPVFEKQGSVPAGIDALSAACRQGIAVIALGGVTTDNARRCTGAGAAGVAGIRLFQEDDVRRVVTALAP